jgi:hypothetical protein
MAAPVAVSKAGACGWVDEDIATPLAFSLELMGLLESRPRGGAALILEPFVALSRLAVDGQVQYPEALTFVRDRLLCTTVGMQSAVEALLQQVALALSKLLVASQREDRATVVELCHQLSVQRADEVQQLLVKEGQALVDAQSVLITLSRGRHQLQLGQLLNEARQQLEQREQALRRQRHALIASRLDALERSRKVPSVMHAELELSTTLRDVALQRFMDLTAEMEQARLQLDTYEPSELLAVDELAQLLMSSTSSVVLSLTRLLGSLRLFDAHPALQQNSLREAARLLRLIDHWLDDQLADSTLACIYSLNIAAPFDQSLVTPQR